MLSILNLLGGCEFKIYNMTEIWQKGSHLISFIGHMSILLWIKVRYIQNTVTGLESLKRK